MNFIAPKAAAKLELLFNKSGANVTKLFTAVIFCHSVGMPSFCVLKPCEHGNYCGMAVNYHSIANSKVSNVSVIYSSILTQEK